MDIKFIPDQHTPETLGKQIANLPEHFVLVGSIGRSALTGELQCLERKDGMASDVDVIDITGAETSSRVIMDGNFRVDAELTQTLRPIKNGGWGLFIPFSSEPLFVIDEEFCQPDQVRIPWMPNQYVRVEPLTIQAEMIDIKGLRYKNPVQAKKFKNMALSAPNQLPSNVQNIFAEYRKLRREYEKTGSVEHPFSKSEQLYRAGRRIYQKTFPSPIQRVVSRSIGPKIRDMRAARK